MTELKDAIIAERDDLARALGETAASLHAEIATLRERLEAAERERHEAQLRADQARNNSIDWWSWLAGAAEALGHTETLALLHATAARIVKERETARADLEATKLLLEASRSNITAMSREAAVMSRELNEAKTNVDYYQRRIAELIAEKWAAESEAARLRLSPETVETIRVLAMSRVSAAKVPRSPWHDVLDDLDRAYPRGDGA